MKTSRTSPVAAFLALILALALPALGQAASTETKAQKIPFHGKLQGTDAAAQTVTLESKKGPRVFHLTADTKITDGAGHPAELTSAVAGEDVGGSYSKDASGKMMLNSLRLGAKSGGKESAESAAPGANPIPPPAAPAASAAATPAPKPAPAPATAPDTSASSATTAANPAANTTSTKAKKQRFSGTVVSVDGTTGTMVVHGKADQTFTVTSSTKIAGAENLGAIAAGAKVSGSYEKSADGATLTVISLKVSTK